MWYKHCLRNVWSEFRLPLSALATVAGKSFNGKFTEKKNSDRVFYTCITIVNADIRSLKSLAVHTLFDKYFRPYAGKS